VQIGYYAQNQAQLLDDELTVFDTIDRVAKGDVRLRLRDILGAFMFGGEASDKKVKVLSGGERSRLAMIRLLLAPVNFLILDEPTNHLDMRTKDVLKEAILAFDGTVILVSHDRDFLNGLVTKVYEFGGGKVREHLGGIYDFLQKKDLESLDAIGNATAAMPQHSGAAATMGSAAGMPSAPTVPAATPAPSGASAYEERKEQARQRRKAERLVAQLEDRVAQLEAEKTAIEARLSTPEGAASTELFEQYRQLQQQIAAAEAEWEQAVEALE